MAKNNRFVTLLAFLFVACIIKNAEANISEADEKCPDFVHLLMAIDTSGSISKSFERERQLAIKLVEALDESAFKKRLKVGLIQFAYNSNVVLPLSQLHSRSDVLNAIRSIHFTGQNTRISKAIEDATHQLNTAKLNNTEQIFVLISDGNGQEYWYEAQNAGKHIRNTGAKVFAASTSVDFNLSELMLYTGSDQLVFVGSNHKAFVSTLVNAINELTSCAAEPETIIPEQKKLSSSDLESGRLLEVDPFQETTISSSPTIGIEVEGPLTLTGSKFPTDLRRIIGSTAQLNRLHKKRKESANNTQQQLDNPQPTSSEEISESLRKHQDLNKVPDGCFTDVVFLIDQSGSSEYYDFPKQFDVLAELIEKIDSADIESRKVKLGIVSFGGKTVTLVSSLGSLTNKTEFIGKMKEIQPVKSHSSFAKAISVINEQVLPKRTQSSRLIVVAVWSGLNGRDTEVELSVAINLLVNAPQSEVYAITLNPHMKLDRLKALSGGEKWNVFVDGRVSQFVQQTSQAIITCALPRSSDFKNVNPSETDLSFASAIDTHEPMSSIERVEHLQAVGKILQKIESCDEDLVDIVLILDSSINSNNNGTPDAEDFIQQKRAAQDILKQATPNNFNRRFQILVMDLNHSDNFMRARVLITPKNINGRDDLLFAIDRLNQENIVSPQSTNSLNYILSNDIKKFRRPNARLAFIAFTELTLHEDVDKNRKKNLLKEVSQYYETNTETKSLTIIAISMHNDIFGEVNNKEFRLFKDRRSGSGFHRFVTETRRKIINCATRKFTSLRRPNFDEEVFIDTEKLKELNLQLASSTLSNTSINLEKEDNTTIKVESLQSLDQDMVKDPEIIVKSKDLQPNIISETSTDDIPNISNNNNNETQHDESPIDKSLLPRAELDETAPKKCKYSKMDLIIILDESTSRENVSEHQRELALSLIERLPISKDGTHVAIGINSFTHVPTLRQTLGLGRDRNMVRKAIEDIKYRGGSTLTAQAVELAVQDLQRGKRSDAIQVVVLMNDGMSQDLWERVLSTSKLLASTGAERFGVALGNNVDLRELQHYIGNDERIYRDGSTERFLNDVISLLNGGEKDCPTQKEVNPASITEDNFEFQVDFCAKPLLDIVVQFDNSDNTPNLTDVKINSNRYLLLDVLGSLPLETQVQLSVITFEEEPKLIHKFSDPQDRESIFERIEGIEPVRSQPSYAKALQTGLEYYKTNHRPDARGLFLIVGDGKNNLDTPQQQKEVANIIRNTKDITVSAVDSGKDINIPALSVYTGSAQRVYNYDRNSEFAKVLLALATASSECSSIKEGEQANNNLNQKPTLNNVSRHRDIGTGRVDKEDEKIFQEVGGKVLEKLPRQPESNSATTEQKKPLIPATNVIIVPQITNVPQVDQTQQLNPTAIGNSKLNLESDSSNGRPVSAFRTVSQVPINSQNLQSSTQHGNAKNNIPPSFSLSSSTAKSSDSESFTPFTPRPASRRTPSPVSKPAKRKFIDLLDDDDEDEITTTPKCVIDLFIIIDCSGSVRHTFETEKQIAIDLVNLFKFGVKNTHATIIKFATRTNIRTIHSFVDRQKKSVVKDIIDNLEFCSGTTHLNGVLNYTLSEYTVENGARPNRAKPLAIIITDGFGKRDITDTALGFRKRIQEIYAIGVHDNSSLYESELQKLTGSPSRVFTQNNVEELYQHLRRTNPTC